MKLLTAKIIKGIGGTVTALSILTLLAMEDFSSFYVIIILFVIAAVGVGCYNIEKFVDIQYHYNRRRTFK